MLKINLIGILTIILVPLVISFTITFLIDKSLKRKLNERHIIPILSSFLLFPLLFAILSHFFIITFGDKIIIVESGQNKISAQDIYNVFSYLLGKTTIIYKIQNKEFRTYVSVNGIINSSLNKFFVNYLKINLENVTLNCYIPNPLKVYMEYELYGNITVGICLLVYSNKVRVIDKFRGVDCVYILKNINKTQNIFETVRDNLMVSCKVEKYIDFLRFLYCFYTEKVLIS